MPASDLARYLIQIERKAETKSRDNQSSPQWGISAVWELPKFIGGANTSIATLPVIWSGTCARWDGRHQWGYSDAHIHFVFHENSVNTTRFLDYSGFNNFGTIVGTGPTKVLGYKQYGLGNNGANAYVDCGSGDSLNITGSMTVMALFKLNSNIGSLTNDLEFIWEKLSDASNVPLQFGPYRTGSNIRFAVEKSGTFYGVNSTGTVWNSGTWYHVAATYDGVNTWKMYTNGTADGTSTDALGAAPTSAVALTLGKYFEGTISDPRWYARVLPQAEIKFIYDNPIS